jgi:hypothetical protein
MNSYFHKILALSSAGLALLTLTSWWSGDSLNAAYAYLMLTVAFSLLTVEAIYERRRDTVTKRVRYMFIVTFLALCAASVYFQYIA